MIAAIGALGTVVVNETKTAAKRVDSYFTDVNGRTGIVDADRDVNSLQDWLNAHRLGGIKIEKRGHQLVRDVRKHDIGKYTNRLVNFLEGAAISIGKLLFSVIVVFVVSIYMLLDFPKLERRIDGRFPPEPGSVPLVLRMEQSLTSYVKGQSLVSLIIGTSAGVGLWLFGVLGWLPHGQKYALLFGAWVAITELIPYLGPWLGVDSAVSVRARRPSRFGDLGRIAVPGDPSGRRSHRRPERDGECVCDCIRCSSSSACSPAARSTGCRAR